VDDGGVRTGCRGDDAWRALDILLLLLGGQHVLQDGDKTFTPMIGQHKQSTD